MESYPFQSRWKIYAHDKQDKDFTKCSYKHCYTISSISDFWCFFNNVEDFSRHQFYIMRGDILPFYECEENKNGGSCSFFIQRIEHVRETMIRFCVRLLSEALLPAQHYRQITGLYLNPKGNGGLLKIWFTDFGWLKKHSYLLRVKDLRLSFRVSPHNPQKNVRFKI